MQYRCPKCQSVKIMPVSQGANGPRPDVPKSLVALVAGVLMLLILVLISLGMLIFGKGPGSSLQIATVVVFLVSVVAGLLFWRDLPNFKISLQAFMQSQKQWKCRDCQHEWQN